MSNFHPEQTFAMSASGPGIECLVSGGDLISGPDPLRTLADRHMVTEWLNRSPPCIC